MLVISATSQTTTWDWADNTWSGPWTKRANPNDWNNNHSNNAYEFWNQGSEAIFNWRYMDNLIPSGSYVYAYAYLNSTAATDPYATYTLNGSINNGTKQVQLNQDAASAGWNYLFAYYANTPGSDYIHLDSNGNFNCVADAIQVNVVQ